MKRIGVKDLLKSKKISAQGLQSKLKTSGIDGNWDEIQNVYNLINAYVVPKDGAIYILLSELLEVPIVVILGRYSKVSTLNLGNRENLAINNSALDLID